jgi:hypothetical protein
MSAARTPCSLIVCVAPKAHRLVDIADDDADVVDLFDHRARVYRRLIPRTTDSARGVNSG